MRGFIFLSGLAAAAACSGCVAGPGYGYYPGYSGYGYGYSAPYYSQGYVYGPSAGFDYGSSGYNRGGYWQGNQNANRGNWNGGGTWNGGGQHAAPPGTFTPVPDSPDTGINAGKNYGGPQ